MRILLIGWGWGCGGEKTEINFSELLVVIIRRCRGSTKEWL